MKNIVITPALLLSTLVLQLAAVGQARGQNNEGTITSWTAAEKDAGYVVFRHTIMESLAPSLVPARSAITDRLSCAMARDEYESIQFGVHAIDRELSDIQVTVDSDLPVSVYHRINPSDKAKLAAATADSGEVARWMSSELYLQPGELFASLPAGQSVNFWLTFHTDDQSEAGLHQGKIRITSGERPEMVLDLEVTVRPFKLQRPRASFGFYFREDRLPKRFLPHGIPVHQVLAMYRDMAEHGHNSGWFYPGGDYTQGKCHVVNDLLPLAQQAGMLDPNVPIITCGMDPTLASIAWLEAECTRRGWPEMTTYAYDEPPYPSDAVRERCRAIRTFPQRTASAISSLKAAYGHCDLIDVQLILGGVVTTEMKAEAKRQGVDLWTYSYSILREGFLPYRQRFYAGFYTWAHQLKGNFPWAYYDNHHSHAWFAPGKDEPLPVTGHEARREGIDDFRYLQMLEHSIAAAPEKLLALEAKRWLDSLRASLLPTLPNKVAPGKPLPLAEYDEIRAQAAAFIEELGPLPNDATARPPAPQLRDDAAAYRGQSLEQCIAGLAAPELAKRRGAAWSLVERGRDAGPAVQALVEALDDPAVRVPALHALETIGPAAFTAIPRITKLLEHPDAFIRMGAVLTLGEIGCPLDKRDAKSGHRAPSAHAATVAKPLIRALRDANEEVVIEATAMLSTMGAFAEAALPETINMLDKPNRQGAALELITSLGPAAADAVSKLVELHENKPGDTAFIEALAAIGPAAAAAIPVLEAYAARKSRGSKQADSYYALFRIRADVADLQQLLELLKDERVTDSTKEHIQELFERLGPKAKAVAAELTAITKADSTASEPAATRLSGFGATPAAEAHYVDGVDCTKLVGELVLLGQLPVADWLFKDDPGEVGEAQGYFKPDHPTTAFVKIRVDNFWDRQGFEKLAAGWYRLHYQCPELPAGKRVYLYFESVDETTTLYIDGKLVAWNDTIVPEVTWQLPFLLEVTGSLQGGNTHLLAIRVGNSVGGLGGIYRPVSLMVEK